MAEGSYLIGIDGGTESVRVGIFDREGTPLIFSSEEYATEHPRPGWAVSRCSCVTSSSLIRRSDTCMRR